MTAQKTSLSEMYMPSEYEEMLAFEQRAYMGWSEPGNDGVDRTPEHIDLLAEQMEREDYSGFDEDGIVR